MDVHNDLDIFALSLTCTSGDCVLIVHCSAGGEGAEVEPEESQQAEDKQGLLLLLLLNYRAGYRGRGCLLPFSHCCCPNEIFIECN